MTEQVRVRPKQILPKVTEHKDKDLPFLAWTNSLKIDPENRDVSVLEIRQGDNFPHTTIHVVRKKGTHFYHVLFWRSKMPGKFYTFTANIHHQTGYDLFEYIMATIDSWLYQLNTKTEGTQK